ncbi:purine-cytosine permease family protein [Leifsonia sp. NPDC102414]|uniref:purine-cytosine permease family protein n=1 Tax=Leifsonia sp. NPDC102414 TaxID=3364124 RepID=UPI003802549A
MEGDEVEPDPASLTDDEVKELVGHDLAAHDTLAAIEHLESVLEARATAAIPIQRARDAGTAPDAGTSPNTEPEPEPEPDSDSDTDGTPTQLISFDDLPVPRRTSGPQPTFSAWIAPAAAAHPGPRVQRPEPLDFVPEEVAPRDSEPVPIVPLLPLLPLPVEHPDAPSLDSVPLPVLQADALAGHDLGAAGPVADAIDADLADDADDVVLPTGSLAAPVASQRVASDERILFGDEPVPAPLFEVEDADLRPTPVERRVGRASRLFWLWFAGTSSLISVGVGATLFTLGLSLRQMLVATLIGVALSFLPLGLGTLAGKWSGQPTMVVSRATFGLRGNVVPAALALLTRIFWGAVLLWLAGAAVGALFTSEGWAAEPLIPTTVGLVVAIGIALAVAYFGYALVARVQLVLTIASAALIVVMIAATWRYVDLPTALAAPDAIWLRVITGAVLVFSYLGLAWANSSAEVARYQRPTSSGATGMLWATFGAALPPFILISYGGMLAASDTALADDFAANPVSAFSQLGLPAWYPVPLLLAVTLSLISGLVLNIYSGGFTLEALGARLGRRWSTVAVGGAIALAGFVLAATVSDLSSVVRSLPTTLAVPVAAWAGLFIAEMMLRTRRFHQPSLLHSGGAYPDWRWTNLWMLVAASAVGLGLISSDLPWLSWEGYLFRLVGIAPDSDIGMTDIGVVVALGIGILTPIVAGVPALRRQEEAIDTAALSLGK